MTDCRAAHSSRSPRRVILLGSTGSIGTQAIDLVHRNPDRFEVVGLSAGSNIELSPSRPWPCTSPRRRGGATPASATDRRAMTNTPRRVPRVHAARAPGVPAYDPSC